MSVRGSIALAGKRIDKLATESIVRRGVAHVPEGRGTFLALSVEENLRLGAYLRNDGAAKVAADFERVFNYFPVLRKRIGKSSGR